MRTLSAAERKKESMWELALFVWSAGAGACSVKGQGQLINTIAEVDLLEVQGSKINILNIPEMRLLVS